MRGRIVELVSPSADRIAPRCRHFGICGGCQWQHLDYAAQVREKGQLLRGALRRVTSVEIPDPEPSPDPYRYRMRTELHLELLGPRAALGYRQLRSHELVESEECPILAPALEAAVTALRRLASVVPGAPRGRYELHLGDEGVALEVHAERGQTTDAASWLRWVMDDVPGLVACAADDPHGVRVVL